MNMQGPRSLRKCAGAKGGTIFSGEFLLHFCVIWKNDPFSKSENVPGLKPRLPRRLRGPCHYASIFLRKNQHFFVKSTFLLLKKLQIELISRIFLRDRVF